MKLHGGLQALATIEPIVKSNEFFTANLLQPRPSTTSYHVSKHLRKQIRKSVSETRREVMRRDAVCMDSTYEGRLMTSRKAQESFVNLVAHVTSKTTRMKWISTSITPFDDSRTQIPL